MNLGSYNYYIKSLTLLKSNASNICSMYSFDCGLRFFNPKNCLNSCRVNCPEGHSVINFLYHWWHSVILNSSTDLPSIFPIFKAKQGCTSFRRKVGYSKSFFPSLLIKCSYRRDSSEEN